MADLKRRICEYSNAFHTCFRTFTIVALFCGSAAKFLRCSTTPRAVMMLLIQFSKKKSCSKLNAFTSTRTESSISTAHIQTTRSWIWLAKPRNFSAVIGRLKMHPRDNKNLNLACIMWWSLAFDFFLFLLKRSLLCRFLASRI